MLKPDDSKVDFVGGATCFVVIVHSAGGSNPTVGSGLECFSGLTGAVMISVV